jgi:hypothetical protein
MARRVFFSFHYERDIWRSSIVRNSWMTQKDREEAGFWDASLWEESQRKGDDAIKRMILNGLENTSVTAVLVGAETSQRRWVLYEIEQSLKRGNGLLGVRIHGIKDRDQRTDWRGPNPLDEMSIPYGIFNQSLSNIYRTYDWVDDNGYVNFGQWVEGAYKKAKGVGG